MALVFGGWGALNEDYSPLDDFLGAPGPTRPPGANPVRHYDSSSVSAAAAASVYLPAPSPPPYREDNIISDCDLRLPPQPPSTNLASNTATFDVTSTSPPPPPPLLPLLLPPPLLPIPTPSPPLLSPSLPAPSPMSPPPVCNPLPAKKRQYKERSATNGKKKRNAKPPPPTSSREEPGGKKGKPVRKRSTSRQPSPPPPSSSTSSPSALAPPPPSPPPPFVNRYEVDPGVIVKPLLEPEECNELLTGIVRHFTENSGTQETVLRMKQRSSPAALLVPITDSIRYCSDSPVDFYPLQMIDADGTEVTVGMVGSKWFPALYALRHRIESMVKAELPCCLINFCLPNNPSANHLTKRGHPSTPAVMLSLGSQQCIGFQPKNGYDESEERRLPASSWDHKKSCVEDGSVAIVNPAVYKYWNSYVFPSAPQSPSRLVLTFTNVLPSSYNRT